MTPHDGVAAYAAARWPAVVRTLVLLGAPPAHAQRLAGDAAARLLAAPDAGFDHATALFAEVLAAWEDDRTAWWRGPAAPDPDLDPRLEARLDRLDPAARARLVLGAVAELTPEQVEEVVVGGGPAPADLAAAVAGAALAVHVDPPAVAAAASTVGGRRRRRRTAAVVGVGLAAALVVAGLVVLVDPQEPGAPPPPAAGFRPPGLPTTERTVVLRNGGDPPVPWYDGTRVHLDARTRVEVEQLRSLAQVRGGAAGVRSDGTVVVVTARDGVQVLGRTRPGALVATSPGSPGVAWLDPGGDLVLAQVAPSQVRAELPDGARLALRDGDDTYLALDDDHLVVDDRTRRRDLPGPVPLDVAGETRLVAVPRGLRVVSPDGSVLLAAASAMDARLSHDGRYLLVADVTSSSSVPDEVVEVTTGRRVALPVPDDGRVVDLAFGTDGTVTLALSRPDGARFPSTVPRGNGAQPGYDLVTCRLGEGTCQVAAQLDNAPRAPLLAR